MNPNAPVSGALYSPQACQGAGLASGRLDVRGQASAVHQQSHFLLFFAPLHSFERCCHSHVTPEK